MRVLLVLATVLLASACGQTRAATPPAVGVTGTPSVAPSAEVPLPQPAPPRAPVNPCGITNGACVRMSTSESWLITDGAVSYGPVPSAFGMAGYETPTGRFQVLRKVRDEISFDFDNTPMPYAVYFTDYGIAFHQGDLAPGSSHGCVHLAPDAAARFFDTLQPGAEVQVLA
ncbi:L,D-transpeptidase [Umezawaea tangerina]|uniref:L,D-transpeptidase-like protein n=1 Tax=Umezawaea tangerina TaxID=84725 RepID=A0A2T0TLY8_9PSEU|nr:L,D-transpeptidase [Umezawaea tangerina]PRY46732.1 L,D-transpeptidase-like protein [Umezawaea tangerina]